MRLGMLLSAMLSATSAHAQSARVAVPVNVPGVTGVTGAAGAVPGAPAGAPALIPGGSLMPTNGVSAFPGPVMLSPFVGRKTAPSDGQAGAARPVRSESLFESAPAARTSPTATARKGLVPPEPGRLAPSAVTAASRHSPLAPASGTPEAPGAPRASDGESKGIAGDAARRLRLAAPWLKPGASTDEILRVLDSLFGGRFPPGKTTARKYASMLLDGFAQTPPAGAAGMSASADGRSALTPALSRERDNSEVVGSFDSRGAREAGADVDGARAYAHVDPLFGMGEDGDRSRAFDGGPGTTVSSMDETRTPAPPRLLRLDRLETETEDDASLGLRIMDSPADARAVSVEDAAAAAGWALERQAREPSVVSDRVLSAEMSLPPAPSSLWRHGWLPFWTAAATSRLLLARSY